MRYFTDLGNQQFSNTMPVWPMACQHCFAADMILLTPGWYDNNKITFLVQHFYHSLQDHVFDKGCTHLYYSKNNAVIKF